MLSAFRGAPQAAVNEVSLKRVALQADAAEWWS
jgi:hypothetical protein